MVQARGLLRSEVIAYDLFSSAQCQDDLQASYFQYVISEQSYQSHCLCTIGSADHSMLIPRFSVRVPRLATWMSKRKSSHLAEPLRDNRSLFQSNARDSSAFLFHIRARQQRWSGSLVATGCYRNSIQILPLGFLIVSSTHTHTDTQSDTQVQIMLWHNTVKPDMLPVGDFHPAAGYRAQMFLLLQGHAKSYRCSGFETIWNNKCAQCFKIKAS